MNAAPVAFVVSDPEWCCATAHDVFFIVWRGAATAERARLVANGLRAFTAKRTRGIGILVVTEEGSPPPDATARPVLAELMRAAGRHIRGLAYFVPYAGFAGAGARSVITAMSLLAREPFPTRTFATATDASKWLASRLVEGPEVVVRAGQIEAAVASVRAGSP